ncbi:hypothetical protein [Thalassotalea sp. SU-HH00458]|uniref:hypothetical protein n=1 Tax=Thalassotalea sp. SU-HH00458 TaxID=3127657 RepID=UPI003109E04E
MVEFNRRKFLSALGCLAVTSSSCNANLLGLLNDENLRISDFEQISIYWKQNELTLASTFLCNNGVDARCSPEYIEGLIIKDFEQDNTIIINGLVISKTEAAIIASTYDYS